MISGAASQRWQLIFGALGALAAVVSVWYLHKQGAYPQASNPDAGSPPAPPDIPRLY